MLFLGPEFLVLNVFCKALPLSACELQQSQNFIVNLKPSMIPQWDTISSWLLLQELMGIALSYHKSSIEGQSKICGCPFAPNLQFPSKYLAVTLKWKGLKLPSKQRMSH